MHAKGQMSWKPLPKYPVESRMDVNLEVPADKDNRSSDDEYGAIDSYTHRRFINDTEHSLASQEQADDVNQRVEKLARKSPRAFRVIADVMHNPQLHSKGGRMFLQQRKRIDKLTAELPDKSFNNSQKRQSLTLSDDNARVTPWNLAATSSSAVRYLPHSDRSGSEKMKQWSPFSSTHLPQPPDLWRSKVEQNYSSRQTSPVTPRQTYKHKLNDGKNIERTGLTLPVGMIHFDARKSKRHVIYSGSTVRGGYLERDFNARPKGWVKAF